MLIESISPLLRLRKWELTAQSNFKWQTEQSAHSHDWRSGTEPHLQLRRVRSVKSNNFRWPLRCVVWELVRGQRPVWPTQGFVHLRKRVMSVPDPLRPADLLFGKYLHHASWLPDWGFQRQQCGILGKTPTWAHILLLFLPLSGMLMIVQIFAQNFLFRYCWKSRRSAVPDRTDQTMASFSSFFLTYSSTKTEVTLDPQVPPSNFLPFLKGLLHLRCTLLPEKMLQTCYWGIAISPFRMGDEAVTETNWPPVSTEPAWQYNTAEMFYPKCFHVTQIWDIWRFLEVQRLLKGGKYLLNTDLIMKW